MMNFTNCRGVLNDLMNDLYHMNLCTSIMIKGKQDAVYGMEKEALI